MKSFNKLLLSLLLPVIFGFLFFLSKPAMAASGIYESSTSSCVGFLCMHPNSPGGMIWLWIPRTQITISPNVGGNATLSPSGYPTVLLYAGYDPSSGNYFPSTSGTTIDCGSKKDSGATGIFVLAEAFVWGKLSSLSGQPTGFYSLVPNNNTRRHYRDAGALWLGSANFSPYAQTGADGITSHADASLKNTFVAWETKYILDGKTSTNCNGDYACAKSQAEANWDAGNFNWFCGSETEPNGYESKSNAYSPSNGGQISSDWVNAATDTPLQINAKAGDTIEIHLNQLIRATSSTKDSTKWTITRSDRATHSGVVFKDTSYGGSSSTFSGLSLSQSSGTLTTTDTEQHPLPTPPSGSSNHRITVTLPAEDTSSYSISFCEQINYQSSGANPDAAPDKWSYVCVQIDVSPNDPVTTPSSCPLPLSIYTPPSAGTIAHGDTTSGSGVQITGGTWATSLYAKPTDNITFAHCVNPEAQAVKKTETITHGHGTRCSDYDDDHNLWVLNSNWFRINTENSSKPSGSGSGILTSPRQISFVSSSSFSGGSGTNVTFTGTPHKTTSATVYSSNTKKYYINIGSAGGFMKQTVTTDVSYADENRTAVDSWTASACSCCLTCPCTCRSKNGGTYSCCCHCPCSPQVHTHWYFPGKSAADDSPSSAWVYVPYNFTTSGTTNIYQGHTDRANTQVVLPDESFTLTASISINTRFNSTTKGTYATEPPADTQVQVVTFYMSSQSIPSGSNAANTSSVCSFFTGQGAKDCETVGNYSSRSAWMSSYPSYSSGSTYTFGYNLQVQNVPDGYLLCSAIGISHADSGDDTNGNASGTVNNNWNIIGPTCRSVANIPNSQVWGGSLISNGHIKTSSTTKPVLSRTFGSWAEFAVIAGGNTGYIEGFGSGASLGYTGSYYSNPNRGGNTNSLFYVRTPLAISNNNCIRNNSCSVVSSSGITSNSTVMSRLITRFISNAGTTSNVGGSINLASSSSDYRVSHASGNLTINNPTNYQLPASTTHIIYAEGDITINGNLLYDKTNGGNYYTRISQIPQYVIIAGGNINIASQVEEIDAWLIAENGTIDTCANKTIGSSVNSTAGGSGCGSQLIVNGPIIAQTILPKRAYGAGAQDSSGGAVGTFSDQYNVTGAEVFNLSIYSYLWAFSQAYRTTEPHTVYTRTLAPRL